MILIDPGAITFIQNTFLQHLNAAFELATHYALNLLYLFAALELAIIGLFWALQQDVMWGHLFFKIIKIGLIFFIIQNYSFLLNTIIRSFAQLGGIVANTESLTQVIFNPASIWLYGYDASISLLRSASTTTSIGLALVQTTLGMGILLALGLLGIQVILQLVGFYLVSFAALIFMPFGVFNPSANMFDRSLQSVLKAGVRVMVLIMVIGVAVTVWHFFGLDNLQLANNPSPTYDINQPLGLFFSALLFLYLAIRLPKIVSEAVGQITSRFGQEATTVVVQSPPLSVSPASSAAAATIQAAAAISPMATAPSVHMLGEFAAPSGSAAASSITLGAGSSSMTSGAGLSGPGLSYSMSPSEQSLSSASTIEKSISDATVQKLKKTFLEMLEEKAKSDLLGK